MVGDYEIFTADEIEKHLVQIRSALGPVNTRNAFIRIAKLADTWVRRLDAKTETQPPGDTT